LDCPRLFVYGTLRRSFQNVYAKLLLENSTFLGPARIRGRLYRIRDYPGVTLTPEAEEWVIGELFELRDPAPTLATLDEYEGCNRVDQPPEFVRVLTTATMVGGVTLSSWVYIYKGPIVPENRIFSGDFLTPA